MPFLPRRGYLLLTELLMSYRTGVCAKDRVFKGDIRENHG
jgi:hypothetical protein